MLRFLAWAALIVSPCRSQSYGTLPTVDANGTLNVGILIMPGLFISEATIPFDVYKHVGAAMNTYFVAETMDPVTTAFGTKLKPHYTFANAPAVDILVVPSGRGSHYSFLMNWYGGVKGANDVIVGETLNSVPVTYYGNSSATISWVQSAASNAKIVTSHCWGAFTLADAGLLDGLEVTTFPGYTETLKAQYPAIATVVSDKRFVISGKVMTSVGGLGAFEASLKVVLHLYGEEKAAAAGYTGLVYSNDNIEHTEAFQNVVYKPSPAAGAKPEPYGPFAPLAVGILLLDGMFISEPVGPWDVFAHGIPNMTAFFVSPDMTPKVSYYGATLYPDHTFANSPKIDVLVVPSGIGSHWSFLSKWYGGVKGSDGVIRGETTTGVSVPYYGNVTAIIDFVRTTSASAQWVTSHCWGAFTLADAGVLDGKVVTTFPGYGADLSANYPAIETVDDTKRIVRDGTVITSNGGIAAYEAPNYLLKLIYGDWEAKNLAIGLVFAKDNYEIVNNVENFDSDAMQTSVSGTDRTAAVRMLVIFTSILAACWAF